MPTYQIQFERPQLFCHDVQAASLEEATKIALAMPHSDRVGGDMDYGDMELGAVFQIEDFGAEEGDTNDHSPCHACGKLTHIDDLDGKPEPRVGGSLYNIFRRLWLRLTGRPAAAWDDPNGATDWTRLECGECYGPGYVSNRRVR